MHTLELADMGVSPDRIAEGRYFQGAGCNHCMNSGFKGRVAAYEVLFIDEEMRTLIRTKAPVEAITDSARRNGFKTLLDAGVELVMSGLTTLAEVGRAIGHGNVS